MIYLSIPGLYNNFTFNNILKKQSILNRRDKTIFIKPIEIEMSYGSFPFSYWNGDINNNYNLYHLDLYDNITNFFQKVRLPVRLDCSNILLNEEDLFDVHQNIILELGNNSNNYVEISSLSVLDFIREKYSNYEFIFSKRADLISPLTIDIINTIIEQNLFYLISLPDRLKNNFEELKNIQNKNKIEITIGNKCLCNNTAYAHDCCLQEQQNQINYSSYTKYECRDINQYSNNFELLEEIEKYQDLGFSHFKIDSPPLYMNEQFKMYLIHNLIQPEHQLYFLDYILTDIGDKN